MRKRIKIFLEKLKFVQNYQRFLSKIAANYADYEEFFSQLWRLWPYLSSKQTSAKGPALSAPRQKSKLADLGGKLQAQ